MEPIAHTPGTVSRILWHFTGGPLWNEAEHRQNARPKPATQAFNNLKSILRSRELRLGGYKEVIRVRVAERRKYNRATRKTEIKHNVLEELASSPVCCLADVPIIHLAYLAPRYGKFAIGFHRESVVRHGFNPVFYALDDAKSVLAICKGLSQLGDMSADIFGVCGEILQESVDNFVRAKELDDGPDLSFINVISEQVDVFNDSVRDARSSFEDFLGHVKTFSSEEFGTIYCEREWRSLTQFNFRYEDIAMVVLPRKVGRMEYFQPFCQRVGSSLYLPATLPVLPWEDLVEH